MSYGGVICSEEFNSVIVHITYAELSWKTVITGWACKTFNMNVSALKLQQNYKHHTCCHHQVHNDTPAKYHLNRVSLTGH